jgi:hypothetical protein
MSEPHLSQYGLTKEQQDTQELLRMVCIQHDAEERAEDIAAGRIPKDTPKYVGDAGFGELQDSTGSRMDPPPQNFDASTVPPISDARSGYKRTQPNTRLFTKADADYWNKFSLARQKFFQNSPSESGRTSAAFQSQAREQGSQFPPGAPFRWQTGFDRLPENNSPKVDVETPTSKKAPATLFSQFQVPDLPEDETEQNSMCSLSGLYGAAKASLASWTQNTFAS